MPIISIEHLSKTFSLQKKTEGIFAAIKDLNPFQKKQSTPFHAVDDISFEIEEGEFVGFLGPNGAGKTTTLKMLSGILTPTSGSAHVMGYTPWERKTLFKKQIAMVMGQKSQLWWDLPAQETFLLNRDMYEIPEEDFRNKLDTLSSLLEVQEHLHTPVRNLSLGQRMKCELIAALLHGPRVLFLDEPTIGLDVSSQKILREFLKEYNRTTKATIILTSHYMEDVKELCKRIIIIDHGKKMYDGGMDILLKTYAQEKEVIVRFEQELPQLQQLPYTVKHITECEYSFQIPRDQVSSFVKEVVNTYPIVDISVKEQDASEIIADIFAQGIHLPTRS